MGWIMDNTSFSLAAELFGMEVGGYFVLITRKWIGYTVTFIFNGAGMKYISSHTLVKILKGRTSDRLYSNILYKLTCL